MEISNERVRVSIREPRSGLFSERFCHCGVVEQVMLDGVYAFCQPEQIRPDRLSCNGTGLVSEFLWEEVALAARKGEPFAKIGVGELLQREDGRAFDMWSHYEVRPYSVELVEAGADYVLFRMEMSAEGGIHLVLQKRFSLAGTSLVLDTVIENRGSDLAEFQEYNHNFLALDNLRIGPGYTLTIPFDGRLSAMSEAARSLSDRSVKLESPVLVEGESVKWLRELDDSVLHKITEAEDILPLDEYEWTLMHECGLAVSERVFFRPSRLVFWAIEHTACPEVYQNWHIEAGSSEASRRVWTFSRRR